MGFPVEILNTPEFQRAISEGRITGLAPTSAKGKPDSRAPITIPVSNPNRFILSIWMPGFLPKAEVNEGFGIRSHLGRVKKQKAVVVSAFGEIDPLPWPRPIRVLFIRFGPRKMDGDNLQISYKWSRDAIAKWLKVNDGDERAAKWKYRQRPGKLARGKRGTLIRIG